jgi:uncharacterized PurR-regulated membrane protein YhhQ (DUF165 family)
VPVSDEIQERRERVFLVLAGIFLCAMTLLNVIGITRFVQLGPMALAVGVLPYPLTFLCTDLVCELYGKARANFLVTVGLGLNFFILFVLLLGNTIPSVPAENMPPWQILQLAAPVALPTGEVVEHRVGLYQLIYATTSGAMFASMLAYIAAQYCDVQLFHFWKRVTRGRYLWVRNNFSTLGSQMVDSIMVISVTFGAAFLRGEVALQALLVLIGSNYLFKATVALLDTGPFYLGVHYLRRYLHLQAGELAIPGGGKPLQQA